MARCAGPAREPRTGVLVVGPWPDGLCAGAVHLPGVCLRTLVTYLVMGGFGYTAREKLFYALAWTPKATVQAALSGAAGARRGWGWGQCGACATPPLPAP